MNAAPVPEITTSVRQFTNTNLDRLTRLQTALQNAKVFDAEAMPFARHFIDSAIDASSFFTPFDRFAERYARMLWEAVEWKTVEWKTVQACTKSINDQLTRLSAEMLAINEGFEQFFAPMRDRIWSILQQSIKFCCLHAALSEEQVTLLREFYGGSPPLCAKEIEGKLPENSNVEKSRILTESDGKEPTFFNPLDAALAEDLKKFRTNAKVDAKDLIYLWQFAQLTPSPGDRLTAEEGMQRLKNPQQQQQQNQRPSQHVQDIINAAIAMQEHNFSFHPTFKRSQ